MTVINNPGGVNLRERPAGPIIEVLANGTPVTVLSTAPTDAALNGVTYTWQGVRLNDNTLGWVVSTFLLGPTITPPIGNRQLVGGHFLQDGIPAATQLMAGLGTLQLPSATIINEPKLLGVVRSNYTIYRNTATESISSIPDDPAAAFALGQQCVHDRLPWITALPRGVAVQLVNEIKWSPGHGQFWLGMLQALDAQSRQGVIGAYAVGQPEPDQWATMTTALEYAAEHAHLVALHIYCAPNTPIGQLSADSADYEGRPARLYNAVPANARPDLVISECAHNFSTGLFEGVDATVRFAGQIQAFYLATSLPVVGVNLFTFGGLGGWAKSSIDTAAGALATAISSQRFP